MEISGLSPITRASFMLTRSCNLTCPFCFNNAQGNGNMTREIAKRAVDFLFKNVEIIKVQNLQQSKDVEISFWGGEPLIQWELLKEITLYAKDISKKTIIPVTFGGTTNGTLLTEEKFDFLDEHKIFFMISIDGAKESHDSFRKLKSGKGSHDIVMRNARLALNRWPFYRVRLSPTSERIHHFFEDMKFLFDFGFNHVMFSPVYEGDWTEEKWYIFEDQCYKLIDYIVEQKAKGRRLEVEHFRSYTGTDNSNRACGAGVFYANIDIDGSIEVCHRFRKFNDLRSWQEREYCIGHIDHGITRPEVKAIFENPDHGFCGICPRLKDTICHGGCPAVNYDFTKNPMKPYVGLCRYVEMQKRVSEYYKEHMMDNDKEVSCMPYQGEQFSCDCYSATYTGPVNAPHITTETLALLISDLNRRVSNLERANG